ARIDGDLATVQKIDTYVTENNAAVAQVRSSLEIAVQATEANAEQIDLIELELQGKASTGALEQVQSNLNQVDGKVSANTVRIDGVFAQINPSLIGSTEELI
ncbi:hypothetical protein, partial [Acinetobacter sp. NigerLNRRAM0016]